jgi:hypothetical protein
MKAGEKSARCRYHKTDDAWLLPLIRELADHRMTYGYRRSGAMLNRKLRSMGKPLVNHKRVYRIMRQNGLLLTRHTGIKPQGLMKARSSRCVPICAGARMGSRLPAGMGKWYGLPLRWIVVTGKSSVMWPLPAALPVR